MKNVSDQVWDQVWRKLTNVSYNKTHNMLGYMARSRVLHHVSDLITNQVRHQLLSEFKENLKL